MTNLVDKLALEFWTMAEWEFTWIYHCMRIHPYIHTYIPTYLHTYIPTYLPTYIHTYIHTYLHTYIHTYLPTYIHTYIPTYLPTYLHTYIHTYIVVQHIAGASSNSNILHDTGCTVRLHRLHHGKPWTAGPSTMTRASTGRCSWRRQRSVALDLAENCFVLVHMYIYNIIYISIDI